MNCDQAFDYLTDSRLRQSRKLKRHLARCARCRDMLQTLEPALDLFDSLAIEPTFDDLGHDAETPVGAETVRIAQQTAARLDGGRTRRISPRWLSAVRLAAAGVLGAAIVLGFDSAQDRMGSSDSIRETAVCAWQTPRALAFSDSDAVLLAQRCVKCHPPIHEAH